MPCTSWGDTGSPGPAGPGGDRSASGVGEDTGFVPPEFQGAAVAGGRLGPPLRLIATLLPDTREPLQGTTQTEPRASVSASPSHFSLHTVFFDLGFLAQIGFLFGLNSIPHPACEDIQELRGSLGQGWGSVIREDCRLGAESRVQSCVSSL